MSAEAAEIASVSIEFHIFAHRSIQMLVLGTIETAYKRNASGDKNIWNFLYLPITILKFT